MGNQYISEGVLARDVVSILEAENVISLTSVFGSSHLGNRLLTEGDLVRDFANPEA